MTDLVPPFRRGGEADAPALADLMNMAGHGLPLHIWSGQADPGQDPWDVGRARQAEKAQDGRVVVADHGSGVLAALTGYAIADEAVAIEADLPALFVPLVELENEALNSWYINVLAVFPAHRNQGWGRRLLDLAETFARAAQLPCTTLIVANDNTDGRRLYERQGFIEQASRPCQGDSWGAPTDRWILMRKDL
ncbi:MAG: N-acetyltransferase [Pseudomonadota bacterium]